MTTTRIHSAELLILDEDTATTGDLFIADGRIVEALPVGAVADAEIDASGCIVTPGLANAHHHLLPTAFRTRPGSRSIPMDQWLPAMAEVYARAGIDPSSPA